MAISPSHTHSPPPPPPPSPCLHRECARTGWRAVQGGGERPLAAPAGQAWLCQRAPRALW
eukprot:354925-Chlamydomonas_euryale.AAC.1